MQHQATCKATVKDNISLSLLYISNHVRARTSNLTIILFPRLTVFSAINVVPKLQLIQLICFQIIDGVTDTSLEQRETLDTGGWRAEIIWIHKTRAFISKR